VTKNGKAQKVHDFDKMTTVGSEPGAHSRSALYATISEYQIEGGPSGAMEMAQIREGKRQPEDNVPRHDILYRESTPHMEVQISTETLYVQAIPGSLPASKLVPRFPGTYTEEGYIYSDPKLGFPNIKNMEPKTLIDTGGDQTSEIEFSEDELPEIMPQNNLVSSYQGLTNDTLRKVSERIGSSDDEDFDMLISLPEFNQESEHAYFDTDAENDSVNPQVMRGGHSTPFNSEISVPNKFSSEISIPQNLNSEIRGPQAELMTSLNTNNFSPEISVSFAERILSPAVTNHNLGKTITIDPSALTFIEVVGKGEFGEVWKGDWHGSEVAIKTTENLTKENEFALSKEVQCLVSLRHPKIVSFYGLCWKDDSLNFVMEFFHGGSVESCFGSLAIVEKIDILRQGAMGVGYLHEYDVIHRDLACRNLLMKREEGKLKVVVSDFGMGRQLLDNKEQDTTKNTVGPVRWMAPEAILNQEYSAYSDVWSFGAMIYELMEETVPYRNLGNLAVAVKVTRDGLRLTADSDNWPPSLVNVMTRCHNTNAQDRPTMADIRTDMINMFKFWKRKSRDDFNKQSSKAL